MEIKSDYRHEGYKKGLIEGKRTGGKVNKRYVHNCLNDETQSCAAQLIMSVFLSKKWVTLPAVF